MAPRVSRPTRRESGLRARECRRLIPQGKKGLAGSGSRTTGAAWSSVGDACGSVVVAHLRGSIPGVSYKPRPTDNQQRRSDARAKRLLGEQLARPRHDGADVPTVASADAESGTDDGRAGSGPEAKGARTEEEEGCEAAQGEEGGEEAPEGQGEAGRKGEEGREAAPPLEQVHSTPRERFSDGSSHLLRRSRGTFSGPAAAPPVPESSFIKRRQEGVLWVSDVGRGVWAVGCSWLARRRRSRSATRRPRSG